MHKNVFKLLFVFYFLLWLRDMFHVTRVSQRTQEYQTAEMYHITWIVLIGCCSH